MTDYPTTEEMRDAVRNVVAEIDVYKLPAEKTKRLHIYNPPAFEQCLHQERKEVSRLWLKEHHYPTEAARFTRYYHCEECAAVWSHYRPQLDDQPDLRHMDPSPMEVL